MITFYPRSVFFKDGKSIGTFDSLPHDRMEVMFLPSDHYDFIGPVSIFGKTEEEIQRDINEYKMS